MQLLAIRRLRVAGYFLDGVVGLDRRALFPRELGREQLIGGGDRTVTAGLDRADRGSGPRVVAGEQRDGRLLPQIGTGEPRHSRELIPKLERLRLTRAGKETRHGPDRFGLVRPKLHGRSRFLARFDPFFLLD